MDSIERHHCQVRLLDAQGEPVGCGFICGERHVLTCTHVVQSCIGNLPVMPGVRVMASFPFEIDPDFRAELRVDRAFDPSPADPDDRSALTRRDVCLLTLEEGQAFPPMAIAVRSSILTLSKRMNFIGTGVAELRVITAFGRRVRREGVQLEGDTGDFDAINRVFVSSLVEDKSIRSGCSGAALFNEEVGLIGMVAESQEKMTGLIIPIQVLREVAEIGGETVSAQVPPVRQAANVRWLRRLQSFDRERPVGDFRLLMKKYWSDGGRGFLCAVAGVSRDAPDRCRDRFGEEYLRACLPELADRQELIDMVDLGWPETRRSFDVEREYLRARNLFCEHVGAASAEPEAIRAAFNREDRPLVFFSRVDHRNFDSDHAMLIRRWADFITAINGERLERPLIHIFIVEMNEALFDPSSPQPEGALMEAYAGLCRVVNEGREEGAQLHQTELLEFFRVDTIKRWVGQAGRSMELDQDMILSLCDSAEAALEDKPYIRFDDVRKWVKALGVAS